MKKRLLTLGAVIFTAFGLTLSWMPGTATAAWADCSTGHVCFWVDTNGNGSRGYSNGYPLGSCKGFTRPFVNSISSVNNRLPYSVRFYTKNDCFSSFGGYFYTVAPGQRINFTSWPHADNFESMKARP